jgi:hypothetical protein
MPAKGTVAGDEGREIREAVAGFLDGLRVGGTGMWRQYAVACYGRPAIPQFQRIIDGDEDAVRGWKILRVPKVSGLAADERAVDVRLMASGTSTAPIAWIDGSLCVKDAGGWKVQAGTWMPIPSERRWVKG